MGRLPLRLDNRLSLNIFTRIIVPMFQFKVCDKKLDTEHETLDCIYTATVINLKIHCAAVNRCLKAWMTKLES